VPVCYTGRNKVNHFNLSSSNEQQRKKRTHLQGETTKFVRCVVDSVFCSQVMSFKKIIPLRYVVRVALMYDVASIFCRYHFAPDDQFKNLISDTLLMLGSSKARQIESEGLGRSFSR
jgi:hypothetical protein